MRKMLFAAKMNKKKTEDAKLLERTRISFSGFAYQLTQRKRKRQKLMGTMEIKRKPV